MVVFAYPVHLLASSNTADYHPFETRDQNVFNLIDGQALPGNARLNKKSQVSWSYDQSQLKISGNTYFMTFGGTITINQCNQLDVAVSEDIKVSASPDVSFLISWHHASHC